MHTSLLGRFDRFIRKLSPNVAMGLAFLIAVFIGIGAVGATINFTGGSGGSGTTIDTATNWSTGAIPTTTDEAVLDNSVIPLPPGLTLSSSQTFGDLVINSNALSTISLSGPSNQTITLSGGAGSTAAISAGGATGDLLVLGSNVAGTVTIGGGNGGRSLGIALGASGNFDVVNSSANANVTAAISGGYAITKTGLGTLTLANNNSFTGGITLSAGTLALGNPGALGSGALTINGGSIDNTSGSAMTLANNPAINIAGSFTFIGSNSLDLGAGPVSLGSISTPSPVITVNANTLSIDGVISDGTVGNQLIKAGLGTLVLSGVNTFSGGLVIDAGTVQVTSATSNLSRASLTMGGTAIFNFASPSGGGIQSLEALTFSAGDGTIQSTWGTSGVTTLTFSLLSGRSSGATGDFILGGAGATASNDKIILTGQSTGFIDPGIFFGGGTLTATYAYYAATGYVRGINYGVDPNSTNVTASAATIGDPGSAFNVQVGNVNITAQDTTAISTLQLGTGNFTLAGGQALTVNGILKAGNTSGGTISGGAGIGPANSADFIVRADQANDSLTINTPILANGNNALVKSGAGFLTVGAANNLTGGLYLDGGVYSVSADNQLGGTSSSPIIFNGGGLYFNNPGFDTISASRPITVNGGGAVLAALPWNGLNATVASNITGVGNITFGIPSTPASWAFNSFDFSGDNSGFSGGITYPSIPALEFDGLNSTGSGLVNLIAAYSSVNLRLCSDIGGTFLTSGVNASNGAYETVNISVDHIASGTGNTLTLNSFSANYNTINITGADGYNLAITTLNAPAYSPVTLSPTTASVAIGTIIGGVGYYNSLPAVTLAGSATGNTIGAINLTGGGGVNGNGYPAVLVASGSWTITGPNSDFGPMVVTGGMLSVPADSSLGALPASVTADSIVLNGGALSASASFTINSNRGIGLGPTSGGTGGTGTLDAASNQTLTYNGIIAGGGNSGTNNLAKTGLGTLVLGGPNTYNGTTTVSAGTLLLNNSTLTTGAGAVNVAAGATLGGIGTINGPITLTGAANLSPDQNGVGALNLNNNNLVLTTGNNVNFVISASANSQLTGINNLTYGGILNLTTLGSPAFTANEVIDLFTFAGTETGVFASLNLPSVTADGLKWSGFDYANGSITLLSLSAAATDPQYALTIAPATANAHTGAAVSLTATITNSGGLSTSDSFSFTGLGATLTGGAGGTIGGPTGGTDSGSALDYLEHQDTTGLTYTNSIAGTYTLTAAVGSVTGDHGTTASLNGTPGTTILHLYTGQSTWNGLNSATDTNWADYGNWDGNGGAPGVYASNPTGDTATFGTTATPVTINLNGANPSITTLTFNSASGGYTIAQGTSGTLSLAGAGAAINVTGDHAISAPVNLTDDTTITTSNSTDSLLLSGLISGAGDSDGATLSVAGPGSVTLTGANTYTNGTYISGGILNIGNGGTTGSLGGGDVTNNAVLNFNRSDSALTVSNNIGGNGVVNQNGTGMTTLSGVNSYSGGTNINTGILEFAQTASVPGSGAVSVASGATLAVAANSSGGSAGWASSDIDTLLAGGATFASGARLGIDATNASGGTFNYASNITDTAGGANPLGLATVGSGRLILSGNNTFTGGVYLNGGTLVVASDSNLGATNGAISFNGGALQFSNSVILSARPITVNPVGGGIGGTQYSNYTVTIPGNISGVGELNGDTFDGSTNLTFSGDNSGWSGGLVIPGGTIEWDGANASGSGPLNFTNGFYTQYLNLRGDTSFAFLASNINSSWDTIVIDVGPVTPGVTGQTLTLNQITPTNNNTYTFTGLDGYNAAVGTLSIPISTSSTVNPTGANVAIGTVIGHLGWGSVLTLAGTTTGNTMGPISIPDGIGGGNGINVTGAGWTFFGSSTYVSNTFISSGGHLTLDFSNAASPLANILDSVAVLNLGEGTLTLNGAPGAGNSQSVNGTTLSSGASAVVLNSNSASNLSLNLNAITRNVGATVDFTQPSGTPSATNGILTSSGVLNSVLVDSAGAAYATVGGTDWAAKDPTDTFIEGLSVASAYSPSTSNSLSGNADIASGVTNTTLAGPASITTLRFNQNQATTIDLGTNALTTGGILVTSAVATAGSIIQDGTLEGAAGDDLVIIQNSTAPLTISAVIADNTTATGLTKSGPGTVISNGNNTYSGVTTVNGGLLLLSGNNSNIGGATVNGGTLQIAQVVSLPTGTLTVNSGGTLAANVGGPGEFDNDTSGLGTLGGFITAATWNLGSMLGIDTTNAGGSVTYAGAIGNPNGFSNFGLAKLGTGTLTLEVQWYYHGATTISGGGTLANGVDNALPSPIQQNLYIGTSLTLGAAGDTAGMTNTYDLAGHVQTLSGLSSAGSATNIVTNSGASPVLLTVNNAGNSTFNGVIQDGSGGLALTKGDPGLLVLGGANTYTGATNVNAGALVVSGSLSGGGAVNVSAGTLGGSGFIAGQTTVQSSAILNPGFGLTTATTLTIGNSVTFNAGSTFMVNVDSINNMLDLLNITGGDLTLNPTDLLTFNLVNGGSLAALAPNTYVLADVTGGGSISGTFTTGDLPTGWSIDYTPTEVELNVASAAVPEPGTWAMLVGGMGFLAAWQRVRGRKA